MDTIKNIAIGGVATLIIGGTAYTFNQEDVVQNFSDDTGLTQEQAEQYINEIPEEEMVPFAELGSDEISYGQEMLTAANEIDCANYEYEWESTAISCLEGKSQFEKLARTSISLGQAYIRLDSDSASEADIAETIRLLDLINSYYDSAIVAYLYDLETIAEIKKTNSFNKALLKAALESE